MAHRGTAEDANQKLKERVARGFANLRDAFRHYDTDHNSSIDIYELRQACQNAGVPLTKIEAEKLLSMFDADQDGKISHAEFMHYLGDQLLPSDDSGGVSCALIHHKNDRKVVNKPGHNLSTDEILAAMRTKIAGLMRSGNNQARLAFSKYYGDNNGIVKQPGGLGPFGQQNEYLKFRISG
jgi:hypothetical protein